MPPEEPGQLVAIDFKFDTNNVLVGEGKRAYPRAKHLAVSWYSGSAPRTYAKICGGVAFVKKSTMRGSPDDIPKARPTEIRGRYKWRDTAGQYGTMVIMIFPEDHTLLNSDPLPIEAKNFQDRIALFWLLWPPEGRSEGSVEVEWRLKPFQAHIDSEVENINEVIRKSRKRDNDFEYDVALSYAGEDREYVEQVAEQLREAGINVFYDKYEQVDLWGKNLYDHLREIYGGRARYTVMFISKYYKDKLWTNFERETAQARAFTENREYILPAKFDDTEVPGMLPTIAYVPLQKTSPADFSKMIIRKLQSA